MTTDAARVADARRWFRIQGHAPVERDGIAVVATPEHPGTWDANFVTVAPGVVPAALFARLAADVATGWQVVHTDCLVDPSIEAALALAGFTTPMALIEMVSARVVAPLPAPLVTLVEVDAGTWPTFAALIEADQREGRRAGGYDPALAAGLIEARRRRIGPCRYWLLVEDEAAVGYGMTAVCPNGLGLIENLFTLPAHRGRGVMSGFIVEAARRLRAAGCDAIFLDAQAGDAPARLYARLGFRPVSLARTWVRRA